ncbi:uracil-DNA glycosylase [Arcobacter sp. s6]|jgi:uracil-DNA glycosylase|uniref:uracil-DNA glycosylase n=1 Tax=Arcobacter sp. s6 TaxID=3230363 RepID=UPI0034A0871E
MTKTVKNQILKNLHNLKSFGYEYHESLDFFSTEVRNFKLPNNLNELKNSVEHCYLCEHSKSRKNVLFAYGNPSSDIMFISDEPSNSEDEMGIFYAGKSGELLSKMIENVLNIKKEDVYLTTLVKCKSSNGLNNSNIDTCNDYLLKQIELVSPKLIVTLGEKAYSYLLKNSSDFAQVRGKELSFNGISLIATFSPSFLLRNPSSKKDAYYDMLKIKNYMENIN